ncbi:hypothetical protein FKM82_020486 [Ascaphus truei]
MPEAFPTFRAVIGSHPCVDYLVFNKTRLLTEAFLTFRAVIGFLPCMDYLLYNMTAFSTVGFHFLAL